METASTSHKGAYLTDVRFQQASGGDVVVAVYRTPSPFTPEEVAGLEPRLPRRSGMTGLELRIRSVPITIASKQWYLYSNREQGETAGGGER